MKLTVMTINLRVNVAEDGVNAWANRIESMTDVFLTHRPIVAGTQEGLRSMLLDLEAALPDYQYVGEGRERERDGEHCAIFYRKHAVRVEESGQFWLSTTPDVPSVSWDSACPRICTWATFASKEEPAIRFAVFNTHLDHVSQRARECASDLIWQHIRQYTRSRKIPVILMGDMNAEPTNPVIQFFRGNHWIHGQTAALTDVSSALPNPIGLTFHGFSGAATGEPIDYIFVSDDVSVTGAVIDRAKRLNQFPSDHFPLVANVEIFMP